MYHHHNLKILCRGFMTNGQVTASCAFTYDISRREAVVHSTPDNHTPEDTVLLSGTLAISKCRSRYASIEDPEELSHSH